MDTLGIELVKRAGVLRLLFTKRREAVLNCVELYCPNTMARVAARRPRSASRQRPAGPGTTTEAALSAWRNAAQNHPDAAQKDARVAGLIALRQHAGASLDACPTTIGNGPSFERSFARSFERSLDRSLNKN